MTSRCITDGAHDRREFTASSPAGDNFALMVEESMCTPRLTRRRRAAAAGPLAVVGMERIPQHQAPGLPMVRKESQEENPRWKETSHLTRACRRDGLEFAVEKVHLCLR
eukprot:superscaffoldBa00000538_g5493